MLQLGRDAHHRLGRDAFICVGNDNRMGTTRIHLNQITLRFFVQPVVLQITHFEEMIVNQGNWPMLELTCCIGFSMNVAYLLKLECALKCSWVECVATNIERMIIVGIIMCDVFDAISLLSQRLFNLGW